MYKKKFGLIVSLLLLSFFLFVGCNNDVTTAEEEVDLVEAIPLLDFSMIPIGERSIARTLSIPTADGLTSTDFINSVMDSKMYADAISEITKWLKSNVRNYTEGEKNIIEDTITIELPGEGDLQIYICTLTYFLTANEVKIYLFMAEPPENDPSATNPFRMYIWNRKNPEGGFTCDYAWASYADADEVGSSFEPGSAENDYLSHYFFRVDTKSNKAVFYAPGYGELNFSDSQNINGYFSEVAGDLNDGHNMIYSDSSGYYIYLDEELSDFEDLDDPNIGTFFINRSYELTTVPSPLPTEFVDLRDNWLTDSGASQLISTYDPGDYIPAFNCAEYKLIWPDYWADLFTPVSP